jgi:hypothetical protein
MTTISEKQLQTEPDLIFGALEKDGMVKVIRHDGSVFVLRLMKSES